MRVCCLRRVEAGQSVGRLSGGSNVHPRCMCGRPLSEAGGPDVLRQNVGIALAVHAVLAGVEPGAGRQRDHARRDVDGDPGAGEAGAAAVKRMALQADVLELRANPSRQAKGVIIEARLDRNPRPKATNLVQEGTLRVGPLVEAAEEAGISMILISEARDMASHDRIWEEARGQIEKKTPTVEGRPVASAMRGTICARRHPSGIVMGSAITAIPRSRYAFASAAWSCWRAPPSSRPTLPVSASTSPRRWCRPGARSRRARSSRRSSSARSRTSA